MAHPRSRGENARSCTTLDGADGSSPLTRGKPAIPLISWTGTGLIPAHAGKTSGASQPPGTNAAHPRSRGENHLFAVADQPERGSSPLTRGKLTPRHSVQRHVRLIPAHAGKTVRGSAPARGPPAHPRSRGENDTHPLIAPIVAGSSPLTRGKPRCSSGHLWPAGLIPAHAGKTLPDLRFYCADRSDLGNP